MTIVPVPPAPEPPKEPETPTNGDKEPEVKADAAVNSGADLTLHDKLSEKAKTQPRAGGKFVKREGHAPVHPGEKPGKRATG